MTPRELIEALEDLPDELLDKPMYVEWESAYGDYGLRIDEVTEGRITPFISNSEHDVDCALVVVEYH